MFVRGLSVAQLIEQRLGLLQIERVEAFGKPAVTRQGQMVKETECPPTSIGA